jgi:ssDNA-binding Zn-finger/Zn-ribbon topoisomerase 1
LRIITTDKGRRFIGCVGYPDCTKTYTLPKDGALTIRRTKKCPRGGIAVINVDKKYDWAVGIGPCFNCGQNAVCNPPESGSNVSTAATAAKSPAKDKKPEPAGSNTPAAAKSAAKEKPSESIDSADSADSTDSTDSADPFSNASTVPPEFIGSCPRCKEGKMKFVSYNDNRFLQCALKCGHTQSLPEKGQLAILDKTCDVCGWHLFKNKDAEEFCANRRCRAIGLKKEQQK